MSNSHERILLMQGNHACAKAALDAGMRFFAGYPITPSSEIAELLSEYLPAIDGRFLQMEDEIAAMGAVIGASLTGRKSMTATSGPGFSLKQENIGYACMTEIPCVIVNVMRGGPSTGLPTLPSQGDVMQARWGTHGDHEIIAICPSNVTETYYHTVEAFNLSEKYRTPVIILLDEIVGHMSEKVILPDPSSLKLVDRIAPTVKPSEFLPYGHNETDIPPMIAFGKGYRFHVTGLCYDETGFPTNDRRVIDAQVRRINRKIQRYRDQIVKVEYFKLEDVDLMVFAYGSVSRSVRQAVLWSREKGLKVGLFRPEILWPFPDRELKEKSQAVKKVLCVEMNLGQMQREVERAVTCGVEVQGLYRVDGEPITPQQVFEKIQEIYN